MGVRYPPYTHTTWVCPICQHTFAEPNTETMPRCPKCRYDPSKHRRAEVCPSCAAKDTCIAELKVALGSILTPQVRAILAENSNVPGEVTGGHETDDLIVVGRIGFSVLKKALDVLMGGV